MIRIDLLGHGGSDKPGAGYEIEDQANAVAEALAKLDVAGRHGRRQLARGLSRDGARRAEPRAGHGGS